MAFLGEAGQSAASRVTVFAITLVTEPSCDVTTVEHLVTKPVVTSTTGAPVTSLIPGLLFRKLSLSAVNRPQVPFPTAILSDIFLVTHLLGLLVGGKQQEGRLRNNLSWPASASASQPDSQAS